MLGQPVSLYLYCISCKSSNTSHLQTACMLLCIQNGEHLFVFFFFLSAVQCNEYSPGKPLFMNVPNISGHILTAYSALSMQWWAQWLIRWRSTRGTAASPTAEVIRWRELQVQIITLFCNHLKNPFCKTRMYNPQPLMLYGKFFMFCQSNSLWVNAPCLEVFKARKDEVLRNLI